MPPADCGSCTLCCKLLGVTLEDGTRLTEAGQWCKHCLPGDGCAIYRDRPKACRDFECVWLQSQSKPGAELPAEMRPDRSHVVLTAGAPEAPAVMVAYVSPHRPDAHRTGAVGSLLLGLSQSLPVFIVTGKDGRKAFGPKATEMVREYLGD